MHLCTHAPMHSCTLPYALIPMLSVALETHQLRKEFGSKVAVADLTLQVRRGEVFGFLGPNGAGKTTSVKMLLGLTQPTSGDGFLLGQPLADRATRARIGYLPEHFRFYEWLQAAEFLDLHARLYGMNAAQREAVVPRLLQLVGLGDRAETRLSAFSKGMQQRIGLAQALLNEPELVFLDEPTSGLDPLGRRLVRDIIHRMREQGTTVFLNSHLLSEVEQTCDRVAFIRDGRVLEVRGVAEFDTHVTLRVRVGVDSADSRLPDLLTHFNSLATHIQPGAQGVYTLTLAAADDIPALAAWLVGQGWPVYELSPQHLTLEDRFLQVIGEHSGDVT